LFSYSETNINKKVHLGLFDKQRNVRAQFLYKSAEGSVATAYMQIYGKCSKDVMSAKIYTDFTAFN